MFDETVEMRSALSDDVPDAVAGLHMNRAGAQAYFDGLLRDWEMLSYDVEKFVAEGDTIVMIGRCAQHNKATGNVSTFSTVSSVGLPFSLSALCGAWRVTPAAAHGLGR